MTFFQENSVSTPPFLCKLRPAEVLSPELADTASMWNVNEKPIRTVTSAGILSTSNHYNNNTMDNQHFLDIV